MGSTRRAVAVLAVISVGCGAPAASRDVAPSPPSSSVTVASEPTPEPTPELTFAESTSTTEMPTTTGPPSTTTTSTITDAATPVVVDVEVEGVTFSVNLPAGTRPDPAPVPPAPVWARSGGSWIVDSCGCIVGFVVQTFVPPLYEPDRIDTFVDHELTWDVYDTGHDGAYLSASTATPDGLWINVVASNATVDVLRAITSTVTISGVRDAPLWAGRVEIDLNTGAISAPGFNDFVSTRQSVEARTASGAALMLIGDTNDAPETTTQLTEETGADGTATVTVTKSNLPDDSIYAVRYQFELQQMTDTLFRFIAGSWTQQCQHGRGHQEFTPDLCI